MKTTIHYVLAIFLGLMLMQACGEEQEVEVERDQQAIEDSLEQAYQTEMEQMRQDSIEQARADSIAAEEERQRIEYSENGNFAVQVEAWRSEEKANQQLEQWKEKGFDSAFVVMEGDDQTGNVWYRIRLGQFDTREMAEKLKNNLETDHETQSWISQIRTPQEQETNQGE